MVLLKSAKAEEERSSRLDRLDNGGMSSHV